MYLGRKSSEKKKKKTEEIVADLMQSLIRKSDGERELEHNRELSGLRFNFSFRFRSSE